METLMVILRVVLFVVPAAVTLCALWNNASASEAHADLALAKHNFLINNAKCLIYVKKVKTLLEQRTKQFYRLTACVFMLVPFEAFSISGHTTNSQMYVVDLAQFAIFGMAFVSCFWHVAQSLQIKGELAFVQRYINSKKEAWKTTIK